MIVSPGLQAVASSGGKLEIAGTVVGQWAGSHRGRGRRGFPIQVVSVGGAPRGYEPGRPLGCCLFLSALSFALFSKISLSLSVSLSLVAVSLSLSIRLQVHRKKSYCSHSVAP